MQIMQTTLRKLKMQFVYVRKCGTCGCAENGGSEEVKNYVGIYTMDVLQVQRVYIPKTKKEC